MTIVLLVGVLICAAFASGCLLGWLVAERHYVKDLQEINDMVANDMINFDKMLAEKSPVYREYLKSKNA